VFLQTFRMDDVTAKTLKHLEKCAKVIPENLVQCKIAVNYAARQIKTEAFGPKKGQTDNTGEICQFCFTKVDVTRSKVEILSKKRRKRLGYVKKGEVAKSELQINCDVCKRMFFSKKLPLVARAISADEESTKAKRENNVVTGTAPKKKKRNKKDPNAGLVIPGKSPTIKTSSNEKSEKKVKISKEKLEHLLKLGGSSKKGGLQQFLKRT